MPVITAAFLNALHSLVAPGMFGIFIKSICITIVALIGFIALVTYGMSHASGLFTHAWLSEYWGWIGGVGATILAWFLFPGIMPIIVNFFDDRIARTIEHADYPDAKPLENLPLMPELLHDAGFSLKALLLNIVVLPLYLVPVINLFVFYVLNGYLLGREFFVMVARRYMPVADAEALRKRHGRVAFISGAALTVLATIPLLNLVAPFWGIAVMTHVFHRLAPEYRTGTLIEQHVNR